LSEDVSGIPGSSALEFGGLGNLVGHASACPFAIRIFLHRKLTY
jgi:hypothetical protein